MCTTGSQTAEQGWPLWRFQLSGLHGTLAMFVTDAWGTLLEDDIDGPAPLAESIQESKASKTT